MGCSTSTHDDAVSDRSKSQKSQKPQQSQHQINIEKGYFIDGKPKQSEFTQCTGNVIPKRKYKKSNVVFPRSTTEVIDKNKFVDISLM